jgi:hypothetical protein
LPRLLHLPAVPTVSFRVAPSPRSLGCSVWRISEFPRITHPPAAPSMRLRVTPVPASTAGSMMTPRLNSNFASSDQPRMNLRFQSGLARSCQTLDAISVSFRQSTAGQAGCELPCSTAPASSWLTGTAFPIPYRVTNWKGVCLYSTCGNKCKTRKVLWISPLLVHKSINHAAEKQFQPSYSQKTLLLFILFSPR